MSSRHPLKRGKGTSVQTSNDHKHYGPTIKTQETKSKPIVKLAPVAPMASMKENDSKNLKRPEKKPGKKVPKKTFVTVLKFIEEIGTFVPMNEESEGSEDNDKK